MPPMEAPREPNVTASAGRIICFSNVFDDQYADTRGESVARCLSAPKRRDLFECLRVATGRELIVLSAPPRAELRRQPRWLSAVETRFGSNRQLFAPNWDAPKMRVPLSWFFYALHVLRHTRDGDLILIDNFEIIYALAAQLVHSRRKVAFMIDYQDGKHLIDRSIWRVLSGAAEAVTKPLLSGAIVVHPALAARLPPSVPWELVPGFVVNRPTRRQRAPGVVRFLYSGSLDRPRGVHALLDALPELPETGWTLDITGSGPLADAVSSAANDSRLGGRLKFHGSVDHDAYSQIIASCDVGLNCQRESDPISAVTFPSKIFSYLSAGLQVLSSRASQVDEICGPACTYYDGESGTSIATAMRKMVTEGVSVEPNPAADDVFDRYSIAGTATRLRNLIRRIQPL